MQITAEKWAEIRAAVAAGEKELFERLVTEFARIAVAHERDHARRCDRVRAVEQGNRPYLVSERIHQ